jgi:hypothetical protein
VLFVSIYRSRVSIGSDLKKRVPCCQLNPPVEFFNQLKNFPSPLQRPSKIPVTLRGATSGLSPFERVPVGQCSLPVVMSSSQTSSATRERSICTYGICTCCGKRSRIRGTSHDDNRSPRHFSRAPLRAPLSCVPGKKRKRRKKKEGKGTSGESSRPFREQPFALLFSLNEGKRNDDNEARARNALSVAARRDSKCADCICWCQ